MRILIFHGYLLEGTGSNVYNARLAAALRELGHEVHLLCQDRHPERQPFVDAVGDWDAGELRVRALRDDVRCTVYRPAIGELLPVYVADRYEGVEARTFARCGDGELDRYLAANVAAVRELAARVRPDLALANHLIMGPVILARALDGVPYAVKVHGSALEYTVKPEPERFLGFAREGLAGARGILVGSRHTARSLWAALGEDPGVVARTRLGPPGVDVHRFRPLPERDLEGAPARALHELVGRLRSAASETQADSTSAFARDELAVAAALERLSAGFSAADGPLAGLAAADSPLAGLAAAEEGPPAGLAATDGPPAGLAAADGRLVVFVGKLIVSKGVDLLLAAWPLVLERVPTATLAVVGFGAYRTTLERLLGALADGRLAEAIAIARAGRALEGAREAPLRHLLAFLEGLRGAERARYLAAARALSRRVVFVGRLDHEELVELLPACEALVVPSTFPEAFGMVAAEGAACGALPISAGHSGLAEVSEVLARAVPAEVARWLSFPVDDHAVAALAERVAAWLLADPELRARARAGLVAAVREHWSWEGVAGGVTAAARGELDGLGSPDDGARPVG